MTVEDWLADPEPPTELVLPRLVGLVDADFGIIRSLADEGDDFSDEPHFVTYRATLTSATTWGYGLTRSDAMTAAMFKAYERYCVGARDSCAGAGLSRGAAVLRGLLRLVEQRTPRGPVTALDHTTLADPELAGLIDQLVSCRLVVRLMLVHNGTAATTVEAVVTDGSDVGPARTTGRACALNPATAATGALLAAIGQRRALRNGEQRRPDLATHLVRDGPRAARFVTDLLAGDIGITDVTTPDVAALGLTVVTVHEPRQEGR